MNDRAVTPLGGRGTASPGVDALQSALADVGVSEALARRLLDRSVDDDAARTGDAGDAAGEVDRAAVVVA